MDETVHISPVELRKILGAGSGDAALLYIAVLRSRGSIDDEKLRGELRWPPERFERALTLLANQGLISRPGGPKPLPPVESVQGDRVEYTRMDLVRALEGKEFSGLASAVEQRLGKKLPHPDMTMLLGLYNDVGLPADVIYTLVCFCVERSMRKYGPGRRPTMRQIEQEGYTWARRGIMDQNAAAEYINRYNRQQEKLPRMMALLGLTGRSPSVSEERYLLSWSEMGFDDDVIEKAYDKTILKCKELRWGYMNKILTSWHEKGFRTLRDVEEGEGRPRAGRTPPARNEGQAAREDMARMEKYLQQLRKQNTDKEER